MRLCPRVRAAACCCLCQMTGLHRHRACCRDGLPLAIRGGPLHLQHAAATTAWPAARGGGGGGGGGELTLAYPSFDATRRVILMDTQGMFDKTLSQMLTTFIFAITSLISSYQVQTPQQMGPCLAPQAVQTQRQ